MRRFLRGFLLPLDGGRLLLRAPGVKRWALAPLLCGALLYLLFFAAALWALSRDWRWYRVDGESWWAAALNAVEPFLHWAIGVPAALFLMFFTFAVFTELLASPFNDVLSEKLETFLTGRPTAAGAGVMRTMRVSLVSTLRLLLRQGFWMTVSLPLLLVPLAGQAAWFLLNGYFTGIAWLDVAMARNLWEYPHKMAAARENRALVTGFGTALVMLTAVPFFGVLFLPLGVAGGTVLYCSLDWRGIMERARLTVPDGCAPPPVPGAAAPVFTPARPLTAAPSAQETPHG